MVSANRFNYMPLNVSRYIFIAEKLLSGNLAPSIITNTIKDSIFLLSFLELSTF